MKEIEYITEGIDKKSTGCFKDKWGNIFYLLNGKRHRDDGPAIEYEDGYESWYFYGIRADSKEQFYDLEWRKKIEIKLFL